MHKPRPQAHLRRLRTVFNLENQRPVGEPQPRQARAGVCKQRREWRRSRLLHSHAVSPCRGVSRRGFSALRPARRHSRLPAQRAAKLYGVFRIRARKALAQAQLEPRVEAQARGERHAQAKRPARSVAGLHTYVGLPPRMALAPVKPVTQFHLVALRRVERRVPHQPRGVLAAPQRLHAALGRAPGRTEPHRQPAPVLRRGVGDRTAEPPFLVLGVLVGQQPPRVDLHRQPPDRVAEPAADLQPRARLRIARVVAKTRFQRRLQHPAGKRHRARAFEHQAHPTRLSRRPDQTLDGLGGRARQPRIGTHRQLEPTGPAGAHRQRRSPAERRHGVRQIRPERRFRTLGRERQLAHAVPEHAPDARALVELETRVGVKARHGACDRAAARRRVRVGALAFAVREHDPGQPPIPAAVESEHRRGHLAVEGHPLVVALEPRRRGAAPRRPLPEPAR